MINLKFWKFVLTIAVVGLLVINSIADPHNLTFFTGESRPKYEPETRATAFALIAAIAAFVNMIPTGRSKLPIVIHIFARFAPLAGAALAGWFALYAATGDNPLPYLQEISYTGLLFVYLAIGIAVVIGVPVLLLCWLWRPLTITCPPVWREIRNSPPHIIAAYQNVANWCGLIWTASSNQIRRFLRRR